MMVPPTVELRATRAQSSGQASRKETAKCDQASEGRALD